jgi:hypothetical protein
MEAAHLMRFWIALAIAGAAFIGLVIADLALEANCRRRRR